MTDRLKATVFCSFTVIRKNILAMLFAEFASVIVVFFVTKLISNYFSKCELYAGNGIIGIILVTLAGMRCFEKHTAFCTANAVSRKNKIISFGIISPIICVLMGIADTVSRYAVFWIFGDVEKNHFIVTAIDIIRSILFSRGITQNETATDIIGMIFLFLAFYTIGCLFGAIKYSYGNNRMMLILFLTAVILMLGVLFGALVGFNPVWIIFIIPAKMYCNLFTIILLNIIITAVAYIVAIKLSDKEVHE